MKENKAKAKLKAGKAISSISQSFRCPSMAEFLGNLGFDIVQMDAVQIALSEADVEEFARACNAVGTTPMLSVRPDGPLMERYVCYGIMGFHVPNVRTPDDVLEVVEAVKFPPKGKRGHGSFRANGFGLTTGDYSKFTEDTNNNFLLKVVIEDVEGFEALPEIVKIPDIDIIQLGLFDMSESMGYSGQTRHPKVLELHEKAREITQRAGKSFGMTHLIENPEEIKEGYKRGSRYFNTLTTKALIQGTQDFLKAVQGLG